MAKVSNKEFYLFIISLLESRRLQSYIFHGISAKELIHDFSKEMIDVKLYKFLDIKAGALVTCYDVYDMLWIDNVKLLLTYISYNLTLRVQGVDMNCIPYLNRKSEIDKIRILYYPQDKHLTDEGLKIDKPPISFLSIPVNIYEMEIYKENVEKWVTCLGYTDRIQVVSGNDKWKEIIDKYISVGYKLKNP